MNILYVSNVCSERVFCRFFENTDQIPSQAAQKYSSLLVKGLKKNDVNIQVLSKLPAKNMGYGRHTGFYMSEKARGIIYRYLPVYDMPVFRNMLTVALSWMSVKKYIKKNAGKGQTCIIMDVLNISLALGACAACKQSGIPVIGVVTDIPYFLNHNKKSLMTRLSDWMINKCDGYVLLTQQMNDYINKKGRPYAVIEGIADSDIAGMAKHFNRHEKKICLYSGSLDRIHGIQCLAEGFIQADIPEAELHIYGDGDFVPELKKLAEMHKNIVYFGTRMNREVISKQARAALLINPRPSHQVFTQFSFPSKNMEYMVSGTPVLTSRLPGMPEEYWDYVYILEDETAQGIAQILKKLLYCDKKALQEKGLKAKEFVLTQKNEIKQAEKVLQMVLRVLNHENKNKNKI